MAEEKPKVRDLRNGDWYWANKLTLDHPYLTASNKLVYHALTYFANNKTQKAYPSIKKIKELTGLGSRTTIVNSIRKLEEYCFIRVKRKKGIVSEYTLLKLTDSKPVQKLNQSKRGTGVVQKRHTNNTNLTILNTSFKEGENSFGKPEINTLLEDVKKLLGIQKFADTQRWTRNYARLCLRDYGKPTVMKAVNWMKQKWPFKPMKMKSIYYGVRQFKEQEEKLPKWMTDNWQPPKD